MNKEKIQYYCECGEKICWRTALYGSGKCQSCARLGRKNPSHSKRMTGQGNSMFGKHHTKTAKQKISKAKKDKKPSKETLKKMSKANRGIKNGFFGKHHTREVKEKLRKHALGRKPSKATREKLSNMRIGNKNSNWRNGISKLPYSFDFTPELKLKIRKRDDYTCQKCGITEEEHIIVYGKVLTIHHIDYDKGNCRENNLIALCSECNSRVNFNRNYWKQHFKKLTKNKEKVWIL